MLWYDDKNEDDDENEDDRDSFVPLCDCVVFCAHLVLLHLIDCDANDDQNEA